MEFSILVPTMMDVAGNIKKTKLNLESIKKTKNFELNIPCYLLHSEFNLIEDLLKFIKLTKRNTNVFSNVKLTGDNYIEAAILLNLEIEESKTTNSNNSLIVVRKREKGKIAVMIKSSSLEILFEDLEKFFENII